MIWSSRIKKDDIRADQKWDFISLNDFKSTSCFTPFAYGYLLISLVISVAVYAVDVFTAVNLLAFDRWSGEIKPIISFQISKWIFAGCIIASFVNLAFEHLRAWHIMRRGAVAESYLDSLAVRLECVRMGQKGRGWRRFLVFAELTRSKKGAEIVALFTYFSFQAWIRIIICQGPQKVINALTLWSVFKATLDPSSATNVGQGFLQFFKKIGILASQDHQQAVILSGMLFTLVIWVFGALSLLIAVLFYIFFLWHYIPNADGGLSGYCERKINKRLAEIVSVKVNKALEEEERRRVKADQRSLRKGEKPILGRQATLPTLFDAKEDQLPKMPMLNRNDTTTTLPLYASRPGTPSSALPGFELDDLEQKRPFATRTGTGSSYNSNAPLLSNASSMGYENSASPVSPLPPLDTNGYPMAPQRSMTNNSAGNAWNPNFPTSQPRGPPRMPSAMGDRGYTQSPVSYNNGMNPNPGSSAMGNRGYAQSPAPYTEGENQGPFATGDRYTQSPVSYGNGGNQGPSALGNRGYTQSPAPYPDGGNLGLSAIPNRGYAQSPASYTNGGIPRSTPMPMDANNRPIPRAVGELRSTTPGWPASGMSSRTPFEPHSPAARASPAPSEPSSEYSRASNAPGPRAVRSPPPTSGNNGGYVAYNPDQRSTSPTTPTHPTGLSQQSRSMTDPGASAPASDYFHNPSQRSATEMDGNSTNEPRGSPNGSPSRTRDGPGRLASPAPYITNFNGRGTPQGYASSQSNSPSPPRNPYTR